jgi:hypothetical protein
MPPTNYDDVEFSHCSTWNTSLADAKVGEDVIQNLVGRNYA